MAQNNQPGYPLPAGELGEDDIVCQLVFLPDRPEYWQAFLGAYHYMTTWRAWERDEDKRGKAAAANWRAAFEMTMECWRMACLEQLQQDVSDILFELRNQDCCNPIDPTDGDQYTDDVEDGVGDVPQPIIDAGYAEDAADWDGFDDYKCMIAHVVVTSMESKFRKMAPHVDAAAMVAGGIASIAIIISAVWTGGLSLLLAGLISSLGGVALFYDAMISGSALETLADKIATNHDELVCAFYESDGLSGSLAGLKDKISELFNVVEEVLMDNSGIDIDAKALYAGRYDQVDTAEVLFNAGYELDDFTCTCEWEGEGTYHFPDQTECDRFGKSAGSSITHQFWYGRHCLDFEPGTGGGERFLNLDAGNHATYFSWGFTDPYKLREWKVKIIFWEVPPAEITNWHVKFYASPVGDATIDLLLALDSDDYTKNVWHDIDVTPYLPDYCLGVNKLFYIGYHRNFQSSVDRGIGLAEMFIGGEKDDC